MEQTFQWDDLKLKLVRVPECPPATRDENMQGALDIQAIRGTDKVARETAMYQMAMKTYTLREWYQPCRTMPGGHAPLFMREHGPNAYRDIRKGIRDIAACGDNPTAVGKLLSESREAQNASLFKMYAAKVSTVESFNESNCRPLLMAHAWLKELNPDGDRAAILLLDGLVQEWYGIMEPETETKKRHAQARHAAINYSWLSKTWRDIWERP